MRCAGVVGDGSRSSFAENRRGGRVRWTRGRRRDPGSVQPIRVTVLGCAGRAPLFAAPGPEPDRRGDQPAGPGAVSVRDHCRAVPEREGRSARAEFEYDVLRSQRLMLVPRAEIRAAARDINAIGVGRGITGTAAVLPLRYEIWREFAPCVGLARERRWGGTADRAHAAGEQTSTLPVVLGLRAWC